MGYNVKGFLHDNPEIAEAYDLYSTCRNHDMVVYEKSKGKDTIQVQRPYPSGYTILPESGGLLDQSHRLMTFFDAFMHGERYAYFNSR